MTSDPPILSIIVPCYRTAGFLHQLVRSVTDQSETRWELIIVDDASPDTTDSVAHRYADVDSRLTVITNPRNLGPGGARNEGARHARGSYLMFLDSDDFVFEESLADIVRACVASRADLVWFDYARVYPGGTTRRNQRSDVLRNIRETVTIAEAPDLLWIANLVTNKAFRTEFWRRHEFSFDIGYYEDIPIAYETAFLAESIRVVDRACLGYRQRPHGSITSTASPLHLNLIARYRRVFASVQAHPAAPALMPIVTEKYEKFVDRLLTTKRHRLADDDVPSFLTQAIACFEEHVDSNPPARWIEELGATAEPQAKSSRQLGTGLLRRKRASNPVVVVGNPASGPRTNLHVLSRRLDAPVLTTGEPWDTETKDLIRQAAVIVSDAQLPDSLMLHDSAVVLDVGASQSFLHQGILANANPLTRPKPIAQHLRSCQRWCATVAQGGRLVDDLRAAYSGNYEALLTGMPRNDALSNVRGGVERNLCLVAPHHRPWQLYQPLAGLVRAPVDAGFAVAVYAPWMDASMAPWDPASTDVWIVAEEDLDRALAGASVLVTDVSPIAFDFAVAGRPILIDADSAQEHLALNPVLLDPTEHLIAFNGPTELHEALTSGLAGAREAAVGFSERYCECDDGNATERVLGWIGQTLRDRGVRSSLTNE